MPQVSVIIAGKTYRMACGPGEEERLTEIAAALDSKVAEMRRAFGEIGDMRLTVMAALTFVDEVFETRKKIADAETHLASARSIDQARQAAQNADDAGIAQQVLALATRIEALTTRLRAEPAEPAATNDK